MPPSVPRVPTLLQVLGVLRLAWLAAALVLLLIDGPYRPEELADLAERLMSQALLVDMLRWLVVGGLAVLLLELIVAAVWLAFWIGSIRRANSWYLRIRLPQPLTHTGIVPGRLPVRAEIWRSLHGIAPHHPHDSWLACTIGAGQSEPATFGLALGGAPGSRSVPSSAALRQVLTGYYPDIVIDPAPDPLVQAFAQVGRVGGAVVSAEFLPRYGPQFPLRMPEPGSTDPLGPLVAAIRPRERTVRYIEAQLCARPRGDWRSDGLGWRAAVLRRLERLRLPLSAARMPAEIEALERKLGEPVFDALLRVVVVAETTGAAHQALTEIGGALGQYLAASGQQAQRLSPVRIEQWQMTTNRRPGRVARLLLRTPRLSPPLPLLLPFPAWRPPAILCCSELSGLWHPPSPELGVLARWLPCRMLPAPAHAFLPERQPAAHGNAARRVPIGLAQHPDGRLVPVGPMLRDLRNILHIAAGMGAGKSRLLSNIAAALADDGFTLIDGKGDDAGSLATTLRSSIALADEARLVLLDISDTEWPVGLNPLVPMRSTQPGALDLVAAQVESVFARVDPQGWAAAPGMQQFLGQATRLVLGTVSLPTLVHVRQALIDDQYRSGLVARCEQPEVRIFWEMAYPRGSEQQRASAHALLRRFDRLLLSDLVRALLTAEYPTFRFVEAIEKRLIVLCPIPHITYGSLAATAAMMLFQSFLRAGFERGGDAQSRREYALLVDEFQVLVEHGAAQDVSAALSQLRALGVPAIYAHQSLGQLGELRDLMLVNAQNRVILRTQEPDASLYARQYPSSGLCAADISMQDPDEHQYAVFGVGGRITGPLSQIPLPWRPPIAIPIERVDGPDWRTILPAGRTTRSYDEELARVLHLPFDARLAGRLAQSLSVEEWELMRRRAQAIMATQRAYLLAHPGCVPNRLERQRWLSRLGYARPRLLAEIEYRRAQQLRAGGPGYG